jgi:2-polyprenyl-6-methoxyphenol hydroxylase-like FAD-dependent oxidoreductase
MKRTVEIAGAGIAGLTTGLAFAQKGWRVRVHEQGSALCNRREGIFIWENGLRVLDALGVLTPTIAGASGPARYERRNHDDKTFSNGHLGGDFRLFVVLRETLVGALHDALVETGGEIVFNSRAIRAQPDGRLHLADENTVHADLIVAADGVNSSIRDSLGLLRWRRAANLYGYHAVIPLDRSEYAADAGSTHYEYWNGSRRLFYAPCSGVSAYVQLTSPVGDNSGRAASADRLFWRQLFPAVTWIVDRLPGECDREWFETVRLESWSSGRVAIIGSAATAQPPILGHEIGCSLAAAYALAQMIDSAGDIVSGLVQWELCERPITHWIQWLAHWYAQVALLPAGARIAVLKAIDASEWAKRRILLAGICRDMAAAGRLPQAAAADTFVYPLIH